MADAQIIRHSYDIYPLIVRNILMINIIITQVNFSKILSGINKINKQTLQVEVPMANLQLFSQVL